MREASRKVCPAVQNLSQFPFFGLYGWIIPLLYFLSLVKNR